MQLTASDSKQTTSEGNQVRGTSSEFGEPKVLASVVGAHADPLWQRLDEFRLDLRDVGLTFSERAAKENAWSLPYTRRVIEEYKRFVYLAMRSGHVACPSDAVDQIWHMHLTYTRSYWEEMCEGVLNSPLHHGPTKGGSEEREKYFQLYNRTKASYEEHFGEKPPEDIWPSAEVRFGEDLHFVRINSAKHWVLPKFGWKHVAVGAGGASALVPIAQLAANPLNWSGPTFLALYFGLFLVAVVLCWLCRSWILQSAEPYEFDASKKGEIGPIEAGWLRGGDMGAVSCSLVDLAQKDAIVLEDNKVKEGTNALGVSPEHRVSELILASVKSSPEGKTWAGVARQAKVGLVAMRQSLEEKGLVLASSQRATMVALTLMIFGVILALGASKIWVGLDRGRPVGVLVLGEVFAAAALAIFLFSIPRLTKAGTSLLNKLKKDMEIAPESLAPQAGTQAVQSQSNSDYMLLWGAGLVGTSYLASTPYEDFGTFSSQRLNDGSAFGTGGCGATGCSADSGCGGDGGGGGCGGGCGGCGGCGG